MRDFSAAASVAWHLRNSAIDQADASNNASPAKQFCRQFAAVNYAGAISVYGAYYDQGLIANRALMVARAREARAIRRAALAASGSQAAKVAAWQGYRANVSQISSVGVTNLNDASASLANRLGLYAANWQAARAAC